MALRLLHIFIFFAVSARCLEGSELVVDVSCKDGRTMYAFNGKTVTFPELETWMQKTIAIFGGKDPIYVRLDPGISFSTVFELARMLTSAGVQTVKIVVSNDESNEQIVTRSLTISAEQILEERFPNFKKETMKNRLDKEQKDTDSLLKILRSAGEPPQPK